MILFHKIVYNFTPVNLPDYLSLFDGITPLRSTHLDQLCFISSITQRSTSTNNLKKSFFYRSYTIWNSLPYDIRSIKNPTKFKTSVETHFWTLALHDICESGEDSVSASDNNE